MYNKVRCTVSQQPGFGGKTVDICLTEQMPKQTNGMTPHTQCIHVKKTALYHNIRASAERAWTAPKAEANGRYDSGLTFGMTVACLRKEHGHLSHCITGF
jgi:hypothetical protein